MVERRLPKASRQQLALLQSALSAAAPRFGARADRTLCVCSLSRPGHFDEPSLKPAGHTRLPAHRIDEYALIAHTAKRRPPTRLVGTVRSGARQLLRMRLLSVMR